MEPEAEESHQSSSKDTPLNCTSQESVKADTAVGTGAHHYQTEQLQWQHMNEQRQLHQEQLDQLKTFKEQLVTDLLTQLSPQNNCIGTSTYKPRPSVINYGTSEISQLVASDSKQLFYCQSPHDNSSEQSSIHQQPPPLPHCSSPTTSLSLQTTTPYHSPPYNNTIHHTSPPPQPLHPDSFHTPPNSKYNSQHLSFHPLVTPLLYPYPSSQPLSTPTVYSPHHNTTNIHSTVKAALIDKHVKRVEVLKSYYETQLTEIKENLRAEKESTKMSQTLSPLCINTTSDTSLSPIVQSSIHYDDVRQCSPVMADISHQRIDSKLQADNQRLRNECTNLESKLQQSNILNKALETKLEKLKQYMLEWQSQAETSSHVIDVLQDKLDATRTQLKQQDSIVEQLQADLQVSVGEIQFWKDQRTQEATKYKQLCMEYDDLQQKNEMLEKALVSVRDELSTVHRERGRLEAAVKTSTAQEEHHKSHIHKLEDRVRHLEHINNRLHGQATHYSLGSFPNSPDNAKIHHHTHSPSHSPHKTHKSTVTTSPGPSSRHTHHQTPLPMNHSQIQTQESKSSPLNRRKWLEPSDPGLILGTSTVTTPPPLHHHRSHTPHQSNTMTSSPLLQSTGQTIVQECSDIGSGNDGEDPTSLTRQSYINGISKRDEYGSKVDDDDSTLVTSTLSAIQRGKIRVDKTSSHTQKTEKKSIEEKVKQSLHVVAEAEKKLIELNREKENLESVLQRAPRHGGRITRHSKQTQLETEQRLEVVLREIGSVKMTLRSHNAFQK